MMIFDSQIKPKDSGVGESVNHTGVSDNTRNYGKVRGVGVPFHKVTYFHAVLEIVISSVWG